jgi:hypothetical protein
VPERTYDFFLRGGQMTGLDLRPLSLGEILDRTFTIYRRYFLLFAGIAGIPQIIVLALEIARLILAGKSGASTGFGFSLTGVVVALLYLIVALFAYLISQAASVLAVSDLYLGRSVSMGHALERARGHLGFLFGVIVLNGLAVGGATILLIVPGIYVACRLLVCVPVALIEERSPGESISRAWALTRENAGRAFMIGLLYFCIAFAANALLTFPFSLGIFVSMKDPATSVIWLILASVGARIASVLTEPILLIATAIFYYDLRVRKEAFDLQFMLDPHSPPPAGPGSVPSIL